MITGLQDLLEIDATAPSPESVPIADCIRSVIGIYQPIAAEKSIALNSTVVENCPPVAVLGRICKPYCKDCWKMPCNSLTLGAGTN
ncbi:hypothetical protein NON20_02280 [Synechocystis sp. B12]|nr:hypothetical protein NON20_02280 [Synechocystis sp. B12]